MPKTDLQRQAAYYQRIIEEGKNSPQSAKYQTMCAALEGLVKASNQLKRSNRVMTPEEFGILGRRYEQVKRACETYLEGEEFDYDYLAKAWENAESEARKIRMQLSLEQFLKDVLAEVVAEELRKAGA